MQRRSQAHEINGASNDRPYYPAEEPLWLDEKKAQRVSYHEATIFALRQAGIHVEPHWFGPVKCVYTTHGNIVANATDGLESHFSNTIH